jgi:hypothetical protein
MFTCATRSTESNKRMARQVQCHLPIPLPSYQVYVATTVVMKSLPGCLLFAGFVGICSAQPTQPCIDQPCCSFPDVASSATPFRPIGRFCGKIGNEAGAGTSYFPHLHVTVNCPEGSEVPVQGENWKPSFYAFGELGTPDYAGAKVECAGVIDQVIGETVITKKSMDTSANYSGRPQSCFVGGTSTFTLKGNSSSGVITVAGFHIYGSGSGQNTPLFGTLSRCPDY